MQLESPAGGGWITAFAVCLGDAGAVHWNTGVKLLLQLPGLQHWPLCHLLFCAKRVTHMSLVEASQVVAEKLLLQRFHARNWASCLVSKLRLEVPADVSDSACVNKHVVKHILQFVGAKIK